MSGGRDDHHYHYHLKINDYYEKRYQNHDDDGDDVRFIEFPLFFSCPEVGGSPEDPHGEGDEISGKRYDS